jgi:aminoglycoside 6'-N-acetyltransferase
MVVLGASNPAPDEIVFRPVKLADLPMLADWLMRPHWREWWGEPEVELSYIRDMIEGRDTTCRPFIFHVAGTAAGYIQVWEIGPHQTPDWAADHPWLMELPSDAVGVDLSVADGARLSQGIGSSVIRHFVAMLQAEGHRTIIIDPDPANARAVASYAKAGFRPVPHLEGRTDGVLIMQFQQDTTLT